MPRDYWDCWDDTGTPAPTSIPPTSVPPATGGPEIVPECYPPRIEDMIIGPANFIEIFITKG